MKTALCRCHCLTRNNIQAIGFLPIRKIPIKTCTTRLGEGKKSALRIKREQLTISYGYWQLANGKSTQPWPNLLLRGSKPPSWGFRKNIICPGISKLITYVYGFF